MNDINPDNNKPVFQKPPIFRIYPNTNDDLSNTQQQDNTNQTQPVNDTPQQDAQNPINDEEDLTQSSQSTQEDIIEPIHEPSLEIVGTAHISEKSVDSVRQTIYEKKPEIVAIELDIGRYQRLIDDSYGRVQEEKFDLKTLLKSSNMIVTLVTAFLSSTQKRMGEDVGVKPGSEMLEAAKIAKEVNAEVALIDRNIQTTLKRTINGMTLKEKLTFIWELLRSYVTDEED
ncbi:MAG TPA: hypothetical protein HA355_02460, partial [Methanosphaera sp.]|nr:hypothetical protein [Methanosphaera sp.]